MATSYWSSINNGTVSRRKVLQFAAVGAGALLAGCSGGSKGGSSAATSKLVTAPVESTSRAVKGGVLQASLSRDISGFDPYLGTGADPQNVLFAYSRLVKYKAYKYPETTLPATDPDAAASWEVAPDGLQYTFKLRPNLKFDARAPTNGRVVSSADVKFSWDRFSSLSVFRTTLSNAADKTAPITSLETPDGSTVVMKLAFPYAPFLSMLAYYRSLIVMPTEANDKFDMKADMRGSGAWQLKQHLTSQQIEYTKNPDWYDAAKVNLDGLSYPIVPEYNTGISQFRAGGIWQYGVAQEDVLATKQAVPELLMQPQEQFGVGAKWIRFGYMPGSPFLDERVRLASSMLIDRDLYIDTFFNTAQFKNAGLETPRRWNSCIGVGYDGFWLNPRDAAFGSNAKNFQLNPTEARRLLQAATGNNLPLKSIWSYPVGEYGPAFENQAEVIRQMLEQGDFKFEPRTMPYQTQFRPTYNQGGDQFEGAAWGPGSSYPDPDAWLQNWYRSGQERSGHTQANGSPDAALDDMIAKQRTELDLTRRIQVLQDIQRYAASKMYLIHEPGEALGFNLAWPWLANWGAYRSQSGSMVGVNSQETQIYLWYDATKKKKS